MPMRLNAGSLALVGLLLLGCSASGTRDTTWVEFSHSNYWGFEHGFYASITHSGRLTIRMQESGVSYTRSLSQAQLSEIRSAIATVMDVHGPEMGGIIAFDSEAFNVRVLDNSGRRTFALNFNAYDDRVCAETETELSAGKDLWNTILGAIESPYVRTRDSVITCPWYYTGA